MTEKRFVCDLVIKMDDKKRERENETNENWKRPLEKRKIPADVMEIPPPPPDDGD